MTSQTQDTSTQITGNDLVIQIRIEQQWLKVKEELAVLETMKQEVEKSFKDGTTFERQERKAFSRK
jgi:hypothetical protein